MSQARRPLLLLIGMVQLWLLVSPVESAERSDPSFAHGLGQALYGITLELPKTTLDATLTGPPVVGTMVGLLAGTLRAVQTTLEGLGEMAAGLGALSQR